MQPSRQVAVQAVAEVATARPERAKAAVEALAPKPEPQPANGQGKMRAQEQTEEARAAAKEAIEEAPAEPETGGAVPRCCWSRSLCCRPEAVQEPPSAAEADQKEEQQAEAEGEKAGEEAKKDEGAAEGGGDKEAKQKAPASPQEDPAFRRVIARGKAVATQQAHNNTAKRKAAEAQAAAAAPGNEVESLAGGNQVAKMAEQQPAAFDKESFKAALIAKINEIAPNTLDDADQFKNRGTAGQLKGEVVGQVEQGKEAAQGPVKETAEEAPDQSSVTPKEVVPQPPTEPGEPPPISGLPQPRRSRRLKPRSASTKVKSIEARQEEAKVTDEMLDPAYSQEADFGKALDAKNEAVEHAETAPAYREQEAGIVAGAESQAAGTAQQQTGAMYDTRSEQFSAVQEQQASNIRERYQQARRNHIRNPGDLRGHQDSGPGSTHRTRRGR